MKTDRVIDQEEYESLAATEAAMDLEAEYEEWMEEVFGETMVTTTSIRGILEASEFDLRRGAKWNTDLTN